MVPTELEPFVNNISPVTPVPALFGIAGTPSPKPTLPLPFSDRATTFDVASNKISVLLSTDQAHPTIEARGSVAAPSASEASKILAAVFVLVVVT